MGYAEGTSVPVDRTQGEIRKLLQARNASGLGMAEDGKKAVLWFAMQGRQVRFEMPLPSEVAKVGRGRASSEERRAAELRRRWRVLLLILKGKLEEVDCGFRSFEQAFMADIVLADGKTIDQWISPQLKQLYETGKMPPMLLLGAGSDN